MSAPLTPEFLAGVAARLGGLPGLGAEELAAVESALGVRLPDDLRALLRVMNGRGDGRFYSYPRDLDAVHRRMSDWRSWWKNIAADLKEQGAVLPPGACAVPVFAHRGVLCSDDPRDSRVLSITENDSVVYASCLREWLELELPAA